MSIRQESGRQSGPQPQSRKSAEERACWQKQVGNQLASSFSAEDKLQTRFRVSSKLTAQTGVHSDGSIYATRDLLDRIRLDEQLAPLLAIELAYARALRESTTSPGSPISMDQIVEAAASYLELAKFPPNMLITMAEWLTKQTTLATLQPAPDPDSMRQRIQSILQARQVPNHEGTSR